MIQEKVKYYTEHFAIHDDELYKGEISNSEAAYWMINHIPLIDIPDKNLEEIYYFRWWTFRKHIKKTVGGYVITEFLPDVPWAGKYNTISCASAHHINEGRWLRNIDLLDRYLQYWYEESENLNDYAHWLEFAIYRLCCLRKDFSVGVKYLDQMIANYKKREETNFCDSEGLFWSLSDREGMEFSISGDGLRLPLNCYMAANALAISRFSQYAGRTDDLELFRSKYLSLSERINTIFWDENTMFYRNIHMQNKTDVPDCNWMDPRFAVRELWGYLPWYFPIANDNRDEAFMQLLDPMGFSAPFGPTTAEIRHMGFGCFYTGQELNDWLRERGEKNIGVKGHECLWNGPSWPFATCQAITAVSNLIANSKQSVITKADYYHLLKTYANSHKLKKDAELLPWIDENLDPFTGEWIARTRLQSWSNDTWDVDKGGEERGKDYNHSTFCDLIINGLFGIDFDEHSLLIHPLFPDDWEYASLKHLPYGGKLYTILWDRDGKYFGRGRGLFVDEEID